MNFPNRTGWTPLHKAAYDGFADVVHLLLDYGADVNAKKQDHWTALHVGIRYSSSDLGQTPFHIALRRGEQKIVGLLSE